MSERCSHCPLLAGCGAALADDPAICVKVAREVGLPPGSRYWTNVVVGEAGPEAVAAVGVSFFGASPGVPSVRDAAPGDRPAGSGCGACGGSKTVREPKTVVKPTVKSVEVRRRESR